MPVVVPNDDGPNPRVAVATGELRPDLAILNTRKAEKEISEIDFKDIGQDTIDFSYVGAQLWNHDTSVYTDSELVDHFQYAFTYNWTGVGWADALGSLPTRAVEERHEMDEELVSIDALEPPMTKEFRAEGYQLSNNDFQLNYDTVAVGESVINPGGESYDPLVDWAVYGTGDVKEVEIDATGDLTAIGMGFYNFDV